MTKEGFFYILLLFIPITIALLYRGIVSDDTIVYYNSASLILRGEWIDIEKSFYPILIYISILILGKSLVSLHLFPFLFFIITSPIFYLFSLQILKDKKWAFLSALLFIFYPTNFVFLNQALTEPIFILLVIISYILYEKKSFIPLILISIILLLTRTDSILVLAPLIIGFIVDKYLKRYSKYIHIGLIILILSIPIFSKFIYSIFSSSKSYIVIFSYMMADYSFFTTDSLNTVYHMFRFYLCNIFSPIFIFFIILGIKGLKDKTYLIITIYSYLIFLTFIYPKRYEQTYLLRHITLITPIVTIFIIKGMMDLLEKRGRNLFSYSLIGITFLSSFSLSIIYSQWFSKNIIPATTMINIVKKNPSLPELRLTESPYDVKRFNNPEKFKRIDTKPFHKYILDQFNRKD